MILDDPGRRWAAYAASLALGYYCWTPLGSKQCIVGPFEGPSVLSPAKLTTVSHGLWAADPAVKRPDRWSTTNIGYIGINRPPALPVVAD